MQLHQDNSAFAQSVNGSQQIDLDAFELSDEEFNQKYGQGKNHGLSSSIKFIKKPVATQRTAALTEQVVVPGGGSSEGALSSKPKKAKKKKPQVQDEDVHISDLYTDYVLEHCPHISAYRLEDDTLIHRWNGRCFERMSNKDGVSHAARWLRDHCKKRATNSVAREAWATMESLLREERFFTDREDDDETIVPCADGYLHFDKNQSITVKPADPALGFRYNIDVKCGIKCGQRLVPAPLDPNSKFAGFLNRITTDSEEQRYLQEMAAVLFLSDNFQMSVWLYGKAKSAKSTFMQLLALFHSRNSVVQMKLDRIDCPFETQRLLGASLIMTDEVNYKKNFHEESFKSIVTQEPISIARKNEVSINNYNLKAKWVVCSNQAPNITDDSEGVWRRIALYEFKNAIPDGERIKDYHKVLFREEGFEILQWVLEGAQRLLKRGRFLEESEWPKACRQVKQVVRIESNSVTHWCSEQGVTTCGRFTDKTTVYHRYLEFCAAAHVDPFAANIFWRHLKSKLEGVVEKKLKFRNAAGHYVQPYVVNVTWSDEVDRELEALNESVEIPFGL
ncbi:hypothetical protein I5U08_02500 [Stenotrophomonas maltophilia]|nr:hypothetical protein [Stenotrophomonas maltophilia]